MSLGFPQAAADRSGSSSDLYPVPPGLARKKNAHASAWDIDRDGDVRSLMSVEPNAEWFDTAHHELGHIYYFLSYDRPEVPFLLRDGANRAFHEAVGELAKLASEQTPYLVKVGVMPEGKKPDAARMAAAVGARLDRVSPLLGRDDEPLRARSLRRGAAAGRVAADAGGTTSPPSRASCRRGAARDDLCDACTKTHINDDPAQYYDYALATMIKFQLHDHICTKILKQDVRACDYSGSKEVGAFLKGILSLGATRDWRDGHQGGDRRADLAARDDGLLPAAGRGAGQAQRRPGLLAVIGSRFAARRRAGRCRGSAARPRAVTRRARRRCRRSPCSAAPRAARRA